MYPITPITPLEGEVEMFSRGKTAPLFSIDTQLANRQSLLSVVPEVDTPATFLEVPERRKQRPVSEVTEIYEEEEYIYEDDLSEFEEDSEGLSSWEMNERRRSQTTISTYDEVSTPHSTYRTGFFHQESSRRSTEGPRGPHLFRASNASELSFDYALQLSPLFPKKQELRIDTALHTPQVDTTPTTTITATTITDGPAKFTTSVDEWRMGSPDTWTTQQVSLWMYNSGVDSGVIDKFEYHDISGKVLMDLQFPDLKELGIDQFGKRHEIWNKICSLRENDGRISPVPTPFEDVSHRNSRGSGSSSNRSSNNECEDMDPSTPAMGKRRRRKYRSNDPITPAESVSIVAIEQLIPKPHKCEKGESCSKWKKQQKFLRRIQEENSLMFPISPENGGRIFMTGNPGNATSARNLIEGVHRPASSGEPATSPSNVSPSNVGPSVVASSDLLGPGEMPPFALQAEMLKQLEERDAQENVKQFLSFQGVEPPSTTTPLSMPMSPFEAEPLEMFPMLQPPSTHAPLASLQLLPRLQIPRSNSTGSYIDLNSGLVEYADPFSAASCRTAVVSPSMNGQYRFGTPASEMDVPVTAIPLGPVARETSQSVPPNMFFRDPVARASSAQGWRRPSFQLPSLHENEVFSPTNTGSDDSGSRRSSKNSAPSTDLEAIAENKASSQQVEDPRYPGVHHAGWMKKRKTKLLRHEWNDAHFRLNGNQLAMHRNDIPQSAILDTLNIDQYVVGCSTIASNKLSAKFKALKITGGDKKQQTKDAFEFQLVPDQVLKGKTHHFAVTSRDERIDWMRELMLAKALKAKRDGYDVDINGKGV